MTRVSLDYDVIIIGGRPAGSTLAARLGKQGLRVLLLERATFPGLPAVSSPIIYASTMKLLDEIGADEAEYARNTPKIRRMNIFSSIINSHVIIPNDGKRDYAYAIDRARFDAALWDTAVSYPSVTGWQNFNVMDILMDGERVVGVVGKDAQGQEHHLRSRLVIGADGRFSLLARKVGAATLDEATDQPTTLYYAYWRGVKPYDESGEPTSTAYEGGYGYGFLVMDSADNTAAVCIEGQAGLLDPEPGKAEALYLDLLMQKPEVARRLEGAEMVTSVRGMKKIGNSYRTAGGPGWALVGDAYHQKDPLDGQGIYNAVFTAKALAWAIRDWYKGEKSWKEAVAWYDETARIRTYAHYKALLTRVNESLYRQTEIPGWAQNTLMRWMMDDPALQTLLGRFLTHQLPADMMMVMYPAAAAQAVVRGGLRDLRRRVEERLPFPLPRL
ncbi:MAG: NAD(P)/FAD-dependent oxidoreductase [bacterium]|nr:NAD(P)/FAD-dependent oxidoreductase [bacterium]